MSEDNKTLLRRIAEELWNERKYERVNEFFAPDFVNSDPGTPDVKDREQFKEWVQAIHKGMSDHHVTIDDMIAEGDKVAELWTVKGTHDGDLFEIPPTNKKITISGITICRIVDGKVKECIWGYDNYGYLSELGVIPSE